MKKQKSDKKFITVVDKREISVNYQLVFSQALCLLRVYQEDIVNKFIEEAARKQMKEDYCKIKEHQKIVKKFLKKYYWKRIY